MIKEYGYEYDATLNEELWAKTRGRVKETKSDGAICLRSGRDCLKVIAQEYQPTIVFMPALACNSMVLPFEKNRHTICYYQIDTSYKIDIAQLEMNIPNTNKKLIFLYLDYFGISAIQDSELEYLHNKYPNLVFVEDRTHNLIWKRKRMFCPDYTMASLRKWINVPDGGLIMGEYKIEK